MLALILQQGTYRELRPSPDGELWRHVVAVAVRRGASALIDAGALLAGVAPRRVAEEIWSELESFSGLLAAEGRASSAPPRLAVIYNEGGGVWWALNADGAVPLRKAPVSERDAFIVFCEQDCRGVDKDLRDGALAVLTLGPRMWKSTLVQVRGGHLGAFVATASNLLHFLMTPTATRLAGSGAGPPPRRGAAPPARRLG